MQHLFWNAYFYFYIVILKLKVDFPSSSEDEESAEGSETAAGGNEADTEQTESESDDSDDAFRPVRNLNSNFVNTGDYLLDCLLYLFPFSTYPNSNDLGLANAFSRTVSIVPEQQQPEMDIGK